MKNKAFYLLKPGELEERECDMPTCGDDEVVVKVEYCGVCGSDVYFYKYGSPDYPQQKFPFILGHEPGGTVIETGKNVKNLQVGDRVAVEPGYSCGHCEWCKKGLYHLCPETKFLSIPAPNFIEGAFRKYISHPAERCFKLADNISTLQGAMIEPLAVGMSGVYRSGVKSGDIAVVMGSGCIGLAALQSLRAFGVINTIVVDLQENRLEKARELGAAITINASEKNAVEEIDKITNGRGADFVFETAGSKVTCAQAPFILKRGGTLMIIGNTGKFEFDFQRLIDREMKILTNFRYHDIYPIAIGLVEAGVIDPASVVTDIFDFKDIPEAFRASILRQNEVVKAVIKVAD